MRWATSSAILGLGTQCVPEGGADPSRALGAMTPLPWGSVVCYEGQLWENKIRETHLN